jgi:hypothetical protein
LKTEKKVVRDETIDTNLFHGFVRVRLHRRCVGVVQNVFKSDATVVALMEA